MHTLIEKLFNKRGITSVEQLTPEEKNDFDKWDKILHEDRVTLETLAEFCNAQKSIIEGQFGELDNKTRKNDKLTLLHSVYSKILRLIDSDKTERERLIAYLNQLIDTN